MKKSVTTRKIVSGLLVALLLVGAIMQPWNVVFAEGENGDDLLAAANVGEAGAGAADGLLPVGGNEPLPVESDGNGEQPPQTVYHTVTFMVQGAIYRVDVVEDGTPANLTLPGVTSDRHFLGWYLDAETERFSETRVVTGDMTLTAKYSENFFVTYLDTLGRELEEFEVQPGAAAPKTDKTVSTDFNKAFAYWALEGQTQPYDFAHSEVRGDLRLVPVLGEISIAVFVTQGSEIDPQVGVGGFTASRPQNSPTRMGYKFVDWYADKDCTVLYDFAGTVVTKTTYIYAKWEADVTTYTLNIWVEKANVNAEDPSIAANRGDYESIYSTSLEGKTNASIILDAAAVQSSWPAAGTDAHTLLMFSKFEYSETKELSALGTTVINVYYTRMRFTFNFDVSVRLNGSNGTTPSNIVLNGDIIVNGASKGATYSLTTTYGADVTNLWPQSVTFPGGTNFFHTWDGYYGNSSQFISATHITVGFCGTNPVGVGGFYYTVSQPLRDSLNLYPTTVTNPYFETRYYFCEITKEEYDAHKAKFGDAELRTHTASAGAPYPGLRYYKLELVGPKTPQGSTPKTNAVKWPGRDISGYETIGTTAASRCQTKDYQKVVQESDKEFRIEYYMPVKTYTLTLVTNGQYLVNSQGYTYTGGNYTIGVSYRAQVDGVLPAGGNVERSKYSFTGWYLDEARKIPYVPGTTMPFNNYTLYAGFEGTEVYLTYTDGDQIIKTNGYGLNDVITEHDLSGTTYDGLQAGDIVPGVGIFEGWYYEIGTVKKAEIEFALGQALTRPSYVLSAKFAKQIYTVSFMKDAISETAATQRKVESGANNTLALSGYIMPSAYAAGYTFLGWSAQKNASVADFTASTRILGDIEVYPVWKTTDFSLSFNMNGATSAPVPAVSGLHYADALAQYKPADPQRDGYTFLYWTLNGAALDWRNAQMPARNITLTAQWSKNTEPGAAVTTYTLSFSLNGATGVTPASQRLKEGAHAKAVADPVRAGYVFAGWKIGANGTAMWNAETFVMPAANVTLYAQWTAQNGQPGVPENPTLTNGGQEVTPVTQPAEDAAPVASQAGITVLGLNVPLVGYQNCWALVNLLLAISGVVLCVTAMIQFLFRKKGENSKRKLLVSRILSCILAAGGVIVFFLTQNTQLKMVMVDQWTPVMAILMLVQLPVLLIKKQSNAKKQAANA